MSRDRHVTPGVGHDCLKLVTLFVGRHGPEGFSSYYRWILTPNCV